LERKSGGSGDPDNGKPAGDGKGTELSDYSSFMDDRSEASFNDGYRPVEAAPKGDIDDKDLG